MNKEDKELTFLLVLAVALGMWLGLLSSCSPQYHMAKFIKKGGKINVKETTISIHDTLKINGKDSIIEKTIYVNCPEMQAPKTRFETRIEYRYKTRVEKARIKYVTKYKTKYVKQQRKIETKNNKTLNLALIVVGLITLTILAFKFSK